MEVEAIKVDRGQTVKGLECHDKALGLYSQAYRSLEQNSDIIC